MGVHKKDAPRKLEMRLPADPVRAVTPLSGRATKAGVVAAVATGVLAAGALMAALAPAAPTRMSDEARTPISAARSLTEAAEPAPLLANADVFPPTPVPTTVRLVPNPRPPRAVAGGMRMIHTPVMPTVPDRL